MSLVAEGSAPPLPDRVVAALKARFRPGGRRPLRRLVEVGAGRRFDVAEAVAEAFPDAEVWVTDVEAPAEVPAPLRAAALELVPDDVTPGAPTDPASDAPSDAPVAEGSGGKAQPPPPPSPPRAPPPPGRAPVDVVLAVRLPPELWPAVERLAWSWGALLCLSPMPEETAPSSYEHAAPGVHLRAPPTM